MNRISRVALFTMLGIAVVWSAGIATAATAAAASNGVCPQVTGVKWVAPYAPHPSGTAYDVHVKGKMTCAKAAGYIKKLVARHVRTNQAFAGGPSGWTCKAEASKSGLAYVGSCNPKKESFNPSDYFTWTVG
jgi:hypothetical protein